MLKRNVLFLRNSVYPQAASASILLSPPLALLGQGLYLNVGFGAALVLMGMVDMGI